MNKRIINYIRLLLWALFGLEIVVLVGAVSLPQSVLTATWLIYTTGFYCFFELLFSLARSEEQVFFIYPAFFLFIDLSLDAAGMLFNLFGSIPNYDKFLHLIPFPFLISSLALTYSKILEKRFKIRRIPFWRPYFIITTSMCILSLHEINELFIDIISHSNAGTGATDIHDTSFDLLSDFVGVSIFALGYQGLQFLKARPSPKAE